MATKATPAVKAPTAAQSAILSRIASGITAIDTIESSIAGTLSSNFNDHVRKAIALGREGLSLMATFTADNPSVRATLKFVTDNDKSVKCSQTRFNNYVRIARIYNGLAPDAITKDIKVYTTEGPPAVNGTNPTFLAFLTWCEKKPAQTLAQIKATKLAKAKDAPMGVDLSLFNETELRNLRNLVRAESAYRAALKKKGGKPWTDYVAAIAAAKAKGKGNRKGANA